MREGYKIHVWIMLIAGCLQHSINAQVNKLMEAFECYQNKNFICAKNKIDSVVVHPETKEEPGAWSLKAYIYYQYFRMYEYKLYNSPYRQEAIDAIFMSESLTPDAETQSNNMRLLKTIAESYYNQIKIYLYDSLDYQKSIIIYDTYKKLYQKVEPSTNFRNKDIEFYLSVGGQFVTTVKQILASSSNLSESDFAQYTEYAKIAFNKVLEIEPNNAGALKGLAITYYNQGAKLIKDMSFDTPIEQIEQIQESANRYLKQALPYMQKAYEYKPEDKDIIEGLTGIYYALHDEKYIEFKKKLDAINKGQQQK